MKKKRILITGGAGFIGSNLALKLVGAGHEVTVLDNLSKQIHGDNPEVTSPLYASIRDKVKFILGSVTNKVDCVKALNEQEVIVHLAAETGTGQSMYQIERYIDVNLIGTGVLLDLLTNTKHKVKRIILASSRAVYGEGAYINPKSKTLVFPPSRKLQNLEKGIYDVLDEDDKTVLEVKETSENSTINPLSIYAITKHNQEQYCVNVCNSLGIENVILRFQNVYGPGQSLSNPYTGILSIFSTLIKKNKTINIFEDGLESRDFVYIEDVTDSIILSVNADIISNKVYNVGSGIPTTVNEVAKKLTMNYGAKVDIKITGQFRLGDIRHCYADISLIKKDLGFEPKTSFDSGLKLFCHWVNLQNISNNEDYENSITELEEKGLFKHRI